MEAKMEIFGERKEFCEDIKLCLDNIFSDKEIIEKIAYTLTKEYFNLQKIKGFTRIDQDKLAELFEDNDERKRRARQYLKEKLEVDSIGLFSNGSAEVRKGNGVGTIDNTGRFTLDYRQKS